MATTGVFVVALMLPNGLEWLLEMCGFDWPTGDEDKMMECANTWRQFAADVTDLQSRGLTAAGNVLAENAGDSIDGFNKTWEKFAGGSGYFDDARQGAELIAICMDAAAMLIIGLKIAVIAQLVILAVEIAAAQAAAPFTLGLSEIGAMGAAAATRMILRKLLKEIAQQILQAVLETAKEPFVSALEAMISDVVAQTVEQNFGKQSGYDLGRTAKTGYEEGKSALENSGSTFGESLRDGAGSRAGHGARHGLSGGDGGDGGDSSSSSGSDSSSNSSSSSDSPSGGSSSSSNSSSSDGSSSSNSPGSSSSSGSSNSPSNGGSSSGNSSGSSTSPSSSGGDSGRRAPDIGGPSSSSPSGGSDTSSPSTPPSSGTDGTGGTASPDTSSSSSSPAPSRGSDPPSPFDVGTQAYQDSISQSSGGDPSGPDSSTPDSSSPSSSTPDSSSADSSAPAAPSESSTPSPTTPDIEGGPAPDTTPDSARPDSSPDAPTNTPPGNEPSLSSDPSPNESTGTTPDVSTSPTPDTTPEGAAPSRPEGADTPSPGQGASIPDQRNPEPTPSTPPEAAPTPAPDNSSPDPAAHQVDRDSVSTMPAQAQGPTPGDSGDGTNNDNQSQGTGSGRMPSGAMPGNAPTSHAGPGQSHAPTHSTPTPHDPSDPDMDLMGGVATAAPPAPNAQSGDTGIPQQAAQSSAPPSTPTPGAMPPPTAGPIPTQAPAAGGPTTPPRSTTPSATTPRTDQPSTRPTTPSRDTRQNGPASSPRTSTPRTETPSRPTTPPRGDRPPDNRPSDHQPPTSTPNDQGMPAQNNHQPTTPQPDATNQTPDQNQHEQQQQQQQQPTAPPPPTQADNLSDIRNDLNTPSEGLTTPDPAHQQDLENAHPRNADGTPQVFADPRQGNWAGLQNDGGPGVPGRSNNCADCTRSFLETWFGRPTVSAPRTLDQNPDGSLNRFSAERDSVDNQERWAGAPSTYAGKDHPNPYARIAHELSQAGHGSAAVIGVNWPGGGGHAFAAVNHNGQVLFVDPQTGVVSENPIHLGAQEVFYTPLDANRNPITPYFLTPSTPQPSAENTTPDTTNNTSDPDSSTNQSTPDLQSSDTPQEPAPDQAPASETPTPDTDATPDLDSDTTQPPESTNQEDPQSDTDQDAQDSQDNQDSESPQDPRDSQDTDATDSTDSTQDPDNDTDQHHDSPDSTEPTPSTATRPSGPPDGYDDPTDADNRAQQERFPRNEDGSFQQAPDPREGSWLGDIRGQNPDDSGRDVNCPDGALAFTDSYAGNPTVAARRSANEDGTPADTPEPSGRDRIENTLGAEFDDFGDGRDAYNNLETTLLNEGHGSQAVIITQNDDGRAHAWNVVNHNGQIVYADPQTGQSSTTPLHNGNNGVFAIPLDANRRPIDTTNQPAAQNQGQTTGPAPHSPAGSASQPNDPSAEATRAQRNQSLPDPEAADQEHANLPPDQAQQDLRASHRVRRIGLDPVQEQMRQWAQPQGDPPRTPLADVLRESIDRRQAHAESAQQVRAARQDLDKALKEVADAKAARTRAEGAEKRAKTEAAKQAAQQKRADAEQRLAAAEQALPQARAGHEAAMVAHRNVPTPSTNFTDSDLRQHLDPAWSRMNDGQRYSAIATMARISQSFHANNAVGVNPDPATDNNTYRDGNFHESAAAWRRELSSHPDGTDLRNVADLRRLVEETEANSPDLSGKNYAVVEVVDPDTNESHYIVDSSVPPGVDGANTAHSESHILKWIDQLNENRAAREQSPVEIRGLFTEREPCGLPTTRTTNPDGTVSHHPTGHANCSETIKKSTAMNGVPVYYGTTYRADPELKGLKAAERAAGNSTNNYRTPSQRIQDGEFSAHLGFVNELAQSVATQTQSPPPAPDQNTSPTQAPSAGQSSPTNPDRTPPPGPAGTDRRAPAEPAGTGTPADGEQRQADDDGQQPQATPADGHDLPDDETLPEGPRGNLPDGSWEGENGLRLTADENAAADDFLRQSAAAEPRITETLQHIAHNVDDGRLTGLDYRLKGEDSLKRKLATQILDEPERTAQSALGKVKDSIRYTVEFPDSHYTHGVQQAVDTLRRQGFENVSFKNTWGSEGYKGINSTWRDPDTGRVFEVQFHTPESFTAKMDTHVLYENGRLPGVSEAEREAIRAAQNDVFGRVPVPEGTEAISVGDDLASTDSTVDDPHVPASHHGPGTVQSNAPPPELSPAEREASAERLHELEQLYQNDFDQLKQDPDHRGKVKPSELDEARVALDLRENGTVPQDIQRPPAANQGDLYSPSTQEHYDIKGVHSSWPPYNNVRDRSLPYKQAYDPENNEAWVNKLREQIIDKNRAVILDVRNANQAAIDDLAQIIEQNGWSERVVWYP
ncbi:toxin glutamine deamidase domain-containing protein [Streptomyces sp. NPDC102381]|uniref:toxin glutamine deamidase domain-containing protein n=1 Tax=Streptomyces sp. NPDC102381 TaxID=3366164 RepID=UPI0037FDA11B